MEKLELERLASFRVRKREKNLLYMSINMTDEEILERRSYIRQALRDTVKNNLPNDVLDNIRLVKLGAGHYLFEDERGYETIIQPGSMTKEEAEFRKCRSLMPFEFMGLKGEAFNWNIYGEDIQKSKKLVNNFILKFEQFRKNGMGLYIYSATKGSGKTMLSCCILNELTERYAMAVKFINALDLLEMTKQTYKGQEPEELKALYGATVLVVDDMGTQLAKEWIDTVFYQLVNSRYNNRLVTIYTSNIAADRLKIDDRIVDRIESTTYTLHLPEKAIRSQEKAKKKESILKEIENAP